MTVSAWVPEQVKGSAARAFAFQNSAIPGTASLRITAAGRPVDPAPGGDGGSEDPEVPGGDDGSDDPANPDDGSGDGDVTQPEEPETSGEDTGDGSGGRGVSLAAGADTVITAYARFLTGGRRQLLCSADGVTAFHSQPVDIAVTAAAQPEVADIRLNASADSLAAAVTFHTAATEGWSGDMPTFSLFEGSHDSGSILYCCRKKIGKDYALSTNTDIYKYDISTELRSTLISNPSEQNGS